MTPGFNAGCPSPGPVIVLLLGLAAVLPRSEAICPGACLCTSDTVNCGSTGMSQLPVLLPLSASIIDLSYNRLAWLGPGSFSGLPRLETLRLARNQLAVLGPEVFSNTSSLRHLDLSSNRLRTLDHNCFQDMWRLEELLLYNNRLVRVESGALSGLGSLRKAYFSLNQLTDFPFFSIAEQSHPFLTVLDLSSNRMVALPWEDVRALPGRLQPGVYLHNNSLTCDCSMYAVFRYWQQRGFVSMRDFVDELACSIYGEGRITVRFLRKPRFFVNCTMRLSPPPPATLTSSLAIYEGERTRLDCRTSLRGRTLAFTWLTPNQEYVTSGNSNANEFDSFGVFANGTLELRAPRVNDTGVYMCTALDYVHMLNATKEVNVTVVRLPESFSTGWTTLVGCAVTLLLILMYLYLTPCRWGCCKQPLPPAVPLPPTYDPSPLAAIFSPQMSPGEAAKAAQSSRRVVFIEPVLKEQGLEVALATDQPILHWEWNTTELT